MKNNKDNAIKTTVINPPLQTYYFYAYQFTESGMWYNTIISTTPEEAKKSLAYITKPTIQRKLCFVCL